MIKHLCKVGNSNALILDRALMELIGLEEDGEVQLTVHDGALILVPTNVTPVKKEKFDASLDRVTSKRRKVLKRLAE